MYDLLFDSPNFAAPQDPHPSVAYFKVPADLLFKKDPYGNPDLTLLGKIAQDVEASAVANEPQHPTNDEVNFPRLPFE